MSRCREVQGSGSGADLSWIDLIGPLDDLDEVCDLSMVEGAIVVSIYSIT